VTARPTPAWLTIVTVCLAVAGCGSDDSPPEPPAGEEAAVAAAARGYLTALGTLDAEGVCASLTAAAQREVVAQSGTSEKRCERVMGLGFALLSDEQKRTLAEQGALQPFEVRVSGRTATGQLEFRGQVTQFEAEKVDGRWKLSSPGEEQLVPE
jgi:hypothetical protein